MNHEVWVFCAASTLSGNAVLWHECFKLFRPRAVRSCASQPRGFASLVVMGARIIKMNAPTSLLPKLLSTSCVRAMNLPTTMTLDPVLSWPPYFCVTCLLGVQGRLIGSVQGRLIWRAVYLEGSLPPANSLPFKKRSSLANIHEIHESALVLYFSFFHVSVAGSPFFSLPDGIRHLFRDHNPYSILHIPYYVLCVIYDLEGSNDVNPQSIGRTIKG